MSIGVLIIWKDGWLLVDHLINHHKGEVTNLYCVVVLFWMFLAPKDIKIIWF